MTRKMQVRVFHRPLPNCRVWSSARRVSAGNAETTESASTTSSCTTPTIVRNVRRQNFGRQWYNLPNDCLSNFPLVLTVASFFSSSFSSFQKMQVYLCSFLRLGGGLEVERQAGGGTAGQHRSAASRNSSPHLSPEPFPP